MILYHFTSAYTLRHIARHGLTVGDVPTDLKRQLGKVGVWLTTSDRATGHGLHGSTYDKQRFRLSVHVDDSDAKLHRWTDWARRHVTAETKLALDRAAGDSSSSDTWYVYFEWIKPDAISNVFDFLKDAECENWHNAFPEIDEVKAVPFWRREQWHKGLLKKVAAAMKAQARDQQRHLDWPSVAKK